jgi:phage I-like protein
MIKKFSYTVPIELGEGDEPPKEFMLIEKGITQTENGPYTFDSTSMKSVLAGYKRRGIRCSADWHHSSLEENPMNPRAAIASPCYYDLEDRGGNLWATNIDWTPDGYDDLKNKRVVYFSPAFDTTKKNLVVEYISFALTNQPSTWNNKQLVAAERPLDTKEDPAMTEEERKVLEETRKALEETKKSHEETRAALKKLEEKHAKLAKKLARRSEEEEESSEEEEEEEEEETREEEAVPPKKGDHDEPDGDEGEDDEDEEGDEEETRRQKHSVKGRASLNNEIIRLTRENAKLRGAGTTQDQTVLVTQAVKRGIITKAQKGWALSNPKAFSRLCKSFKGNTVNHTPRETSTTTQTTTRKPSESEMKLARSLHLSDEEFSKVR